MRRALFIIIFLDCTAILFSCSNKPPAPDVEQVTSITNEQPDMPLTLLDSTVLNVRDLKGQTILIFFQPDCDHCQREASDFKKNISSFTGATMYFITSAPLAEIEQFSKDYGLTVYPNVFFAFTQAKFILQYYGPIDVPSVYIYSSDHKLVKAFNGETRVDMILSFM